MTEELSGFSTMSVLIVDDNAANVALLQAWLHEAGMHRVTVETDSRRVERLLSEADPDLVLLDLHMPHLDGHQVLQQINRFAAGTYLPVLILTADTTHAARDLALANGARDFLTKPLDANETILRIANLLETRQLYADLRKTAAEKKIRMSSLGRKQRNARGYLDAIISGAEGLELVFQPVVELTSLKTVGYEGLSRFAMPHDHGPAGWFSDAFDVGLGTQLEWFAASKALAILSADPPDQFLAVNMSPASVLRLSEQEFCDPHLCSRIVIELTEHVPIEDYSALHHALRPMRERGTRLAADDLGAGYAGFRHLMLLEPDIIKLDISLVRGIHLSRNQRALARSLVAFANEVGSIVIAEGVEQIEELEECLDIGVPWGQGYYLGRPAAYPGGQVVPKPRADSAIATNLKKKELPRQTIG